MMKKKKNLRMCRRQQHLKKERNGNAAVVQNIQALADETFFYKYN